MFFPQYQLPRSFKRAGASALILIAATACSKGCGRGGADLSDAEKNGKKIFNMVRTNAYRSLDPVKQFDEASSEIIQNVYDTLLTYHYLKRPYQLVPSLAESMPTVSDDRVTYTFKLRSGVKFHDDACFEGGIGRELTADDVIYSLKRFADANVNVLSYALMQGYIEGMDLFRAQTKEKGKDANYDELDISGIKKVDQYTLTIKFTRPNPLALYPFAMSQLSIVPREAVEKYGDEFERHVVGTGAFIVKDYARRGEMVLVKNPDYFMTYPSEGEDADAENGLLAAAGQKLPFVDEVRMPLIEEAQPAILSIQKGTLDNVGIDQDNFSKFFEYGDDGQLRLKKEWEGKLDGYATPGLSMENFKFNMKDPLVGGYDAKKKALRKAIAYALDVPGYIKLILNGRAEKLNSIVPHPIAGSEWDIEANYFSTNLEKAKELLAEAGYPGGEGLPEITIEYRASTSNTRKAFEFERAQLAKVGIKVNANYQTFSAWLQKTERGNYQISNAGWMADYPDAENFYQLLYGPNTPPGPNDGSYSNPEYDKLYEEIRFMENGPERFKKFARMNEILMEDVPKIVLFNAKRVGLLTPWIRNYKRNIMYNPPLRYVDIDLARKP